MPSAQSLRLLDFSFSDFELSDMETTLATVRMFVDLNLVQNFQMKYKVRTRAQLGEVQTIDLLTDSRFND